jgi:hypothetical protein
MMIARLCPSPTAAEKGLAPTVRIPHKGPDFTAIEQLSLRKQWIPLELDVASTSSRCSFKDGKGGLRRGGIKKRTIFLVTVTCTVTVTATMRQNLL